MITATDQAVLTAWEDFLQLPDPEEEVSHYELHDGEVVLVPHPRPIHVVKIERQRLAAFAGGTREFWVIDPLSRTIEVSIPGQASRIYAADEDVPLSVIPGANLAARKLFEE